MERRMRGNSHVRCEVGENPEAEICGFAAYHTKDYLSLSAPAILFACLLFSLTAPSYIWNIL